MVFWRPWPIQVAGWVGVGTHGGPAGCCRDWVHFGASPRDANQDSADTLTYTLKCIAELEEKHGGADPASWRWGDGTPCADVFAADDAKRKHDSLKAKAATLQQVPDGADGSGATRDRSRSPRRSQVPASSGA